MAKTMVAATAQAAQRWAGTPNRKNVFIRLISD
jgi:hypothetical protein